MLEYNADTPTSLLESAVCQWYWLRGSISVRRSIQLDPRTLMARWRQLPGSNAIHLASLDGNEEDWACTTYLIDTVAQAGREAGHIPIEDIGWDPSRGTFVDTQGQAIEQLFKLYPWEWMMRGRFWGAHCCEQYPVHRTPLEGRSVLQGAAAHPLGPVSRAPEFAAGLLRAGTLEFLRQKTSLLERGRQHRIVFEQCMSRQGRWTLWRARIRLPSFANASRVRRSLCRGRLVGDRRSERGYVHPRRLISHHFQYQ